MKLTKDEITLIEEALAALLASEREAGLEFARSHYVVPSPDGQPKYFEGDWQALVAESNTPRGRPAWMDGYDRKEREVKAILAKLKAPSEAKTPSRKK